ncbi:GTP-binding protein 10 isoform X2 [Clupea harengus]|uniref:GTP-binding protein 10 isoform X2 n=1 Tax=Clupea harengus TaxID=7950 RepID=A0A8M1KTP2_CLUHA|nr:GTP-binding protein 10 isoform X2 [Clupea harengus]
MDCGWTLALALLLMVEGHRDDLCPRRDPPPGVMVLTPGSEVLLHCHGDVIVDRVLKVQGNTERPFIRAYQQDAGTTSDEGYLGKTAETSTATYKMETGRSLTEATDDTSRGKYQKETGVTSSDRSHEKDRETKPGTYQRETRRTATEGFHRERGGTSSEGYDESTGGTLQGAHERERRDVTETQPNEYRPTVTTETVTSVNQGETFSTTEWPQMTKMADTARAASPPLLQDDATEEGAAARPKRKRQSYWTLDGVVVQGSAEMRVLRLPHLGLRDAGNYSCYREGALMSTVKITLGTPPVSPSLSCYRKSHESKIRCNWTSPQPVVPLPKCYILLEKRCVSTCKRALCVCVTAYK